MDRRRFLLTSLAGALATPLPAWPQQIGKVWRIGWLHFGSGGPRSTFRDALREIGYVEGKNIAFEVRTGDGRHERLPALAAELVALKVDVIVAVAPAAIRAAKVATTNIPILMAYWGGPDLVESGIVTARSRPGGNVTGVDMLNTALDAKRLELLLEALPQARKLAVLIHGGDGNRLGWEKQLTAVRALADRAGKSLELIDVGRDQAGYIEAFASFKAALADGLLVPSSPIFSRDRHILIGLAAQHRVPTMFELPSIAQDGGLMAYSASVAEMDRQVATLLDKVIKGARPGDLPIEQPTKFELVINLKTAKALGLTIPPSLLARADQLIE